MYSYTERFNNTANKTRHPPPRMYPQAVQIDYGLYAFLSPVLNRAYCSTFVLDFSTKKPMKMQKKKTKQNEKSRHTIYSLGGISSFSYYLLYFGKEIKCETNVVDGGSVYIQSHFSLGGGELWGLEPTPCSTSHSTSLCLSADICPSLHRSDYDLEYDCYQDDFYER